MAKYMVRMRVTRVHHFFIEANSMEDAEEKAEDLDEANSSTDMFDSDEILDICEVEL